MPARVRSTCPQTQTPFPLYRPALRYEGHPAGPFCFSLFSSTGIPACANTTPQRDCKCSATPPPRSFRTTVTCQEVRRVPSGSSRVSLLVPQAAPAGAMKNGCLCAVAKPQRSKVGWLTESHPMHLRERLAPYLPPQPLSVNLLPLAASPQLYARLIARLISNSVLQPEYYRR